jgi:membrane protein implicated in regulation of membrane protease activity
VDWPLAIVLAVVFVVMSVVRWRYFQSVARRRNARAEQAPPPE